VKPAEPLGRAERRRLFRRPASNLAQLHAFEMYGRLELVPVTADPAPWHLSLDQGEALQLAAVLQEWASGPRIMREGPTPDPS